jgi:hypothetical protein
MQGSHNCDLTIILLEGNKIMVLNEVTRLWALGKEDSADGGSDYTLMRKSIVL